MPYLCANCALLSRYNEVLNTMTTVENQNGLVYGIIWNENVIYAYSKKIISVHVW